ncbi:histidine kinase [Fischerella thermalis WC542]|uniref:Adaptive-response sensory-kinase SasA n=3 Tax=Fischerella TaxID=1190 RepID=G6FNE2_9CYAN|nr:histidine kinase [Fischerella thermalis JSC-11]PLZ09090.1 histidine kinase [Fischerella thermalis WC114]PLZ09459.1 histidine kinase [Fischerella thermalis WC1110]PLZ15039.1 histidine kinase [Fischerella thermalis WC119]PLZ18691.1 histidine kinase [Fischerella thermalis WC157]PLZ26205.1 histidine kinase [Fischerella thermalis WC341]PLZ35488.1 histidine kinase [Fischerella thermalis WC559]PLZ37968.1 histidine kinase [Fischerella thermalis WC558]PLZ42470.1 histidine kinase [Fischerella ther
MQASQDQPISSEAPLQLLLFVDGRPKSRQQVQRIRAYLKELQADYKFELQIVDVGQQPYLAEHFKLVATPALIKIHPEPRHVLAGSNIITQLKSWWPRWQAAVDAYVKLQTDLQENTEDNGRNASSSKSSIRSVALSAELLHLSDEIFRLKQEKEQLEEQLQFKDRVIAMLAHDLRNPLTATAIAIETLQSNYNPDKAGFERLTPTTTTNLFKQARNQTRIIDRMITDLLQAGRNNEREFPVKPQKTNLGQLCLDVLEELSDRYAAKSLKVEKDIPKDLPQVYADPERIRQVLINLLDNAIKYTPEGGTISVAGLHRTTQKVQFSIGDTGPGIPEENRDRIFENHFRLERDESKEGYGIGLCLCQRIIRAHYGQIWVDSSPSNGAWFHFTLPVYM